jgi:hypothetical protein
VLAAELTRDAVFEALRERRCYGTTGPRIDLCFEVDQRPMGTAFEATGDVTARASVRGAGPVESLTLLRGREPLLVIQPAVFDDVTRSKRVRVRWQGARIRGRGRRVTWSGTIRVEGARIRAARTFAFDSAADGITEQTDREVRFRSQTTGDADGIDLWLDQAQRGSVEFESPVGRFRADLDDLQPKRSWRLDGVDMQVDIQRYPEQANATELQLVAPLSPERGRQTPYLVKVTQVDGNLAWSSPVYVSRPD